MLSYKNKNILLIHSRQVWSISFFCFLVGGGGGGEGRTSWWEAWNFNLLLV